MAMQELDGNNINTERLGRPKKSDQTRRDSMIYMKVSQIELRLIREKAKKQNLAVSTYCRQASLMWSRK